MKAYKYSLINRKCIQVKTLNTYNFIHCTVKHSKFVVDFNTGTETQSKDYAGLTFFFKIVKYTHLPETP